MCPPMPPRPVDETSIPTGEVRSVSGAMDLRQKTRIGALAEGEGFQDVRARQRKGSQGTQIRAADNGSTLTVGQGTALFVRWQA